MYDIIRLKYFILELNMEIKSFKTLKSLQTFVQEQLKLYIIESNLREGDLLPTEKELSQSLGVSRTAIREALKVLEALGLIETRHGVGRFVNNFNYDAILKSLPYSLKLDINTFKDIFEVRYCLECCFIAANINKYEPSDIKELTNILDNIEVQIRNNVEEKDLIDLHTAFHIFLYKKSQNNLLIDLIKIFSTIQRNLVILHRYKTKDRLGFVHLHQMIVKAIEAKDSNLAQRRLREHFSEAMKWINDNLKDKIDLDIYEGFWSK